MTTNARKITNASMKNTWMESLMDFLVINRQPVLPAKAHKIQLKSKQYMIINDIL